MDKREHARKLPPLASSEDLSEDLLDSPEADSKNKCLEDIVEVPSTPAKSPRQQTLCLAMPNTPRIDISRASSSSHHDDSSPERDLFAGKSRRHVKRRGFDEVNVRVRRHSNGSLVSLLFDFPPVSTGSFFLGLVVMVVVMLV